MAPKGLTENSTEEEVHAYLSNPESCSMITLMETAIRCTILRCSVKTWLSHSAARAPLQGWITSATSYTQGFLIPRIEGRFVNFGFSDASVASGFTSAIDNPSDAITMGTPRGPN